MTESPLKFLSEAKLAQLHADIGVNRNRYASGDFHDLKSDNGWAIETSSVRVDLDILAGLDGAEGTAKADLANSLIVYQALRGMTPSLAREERVWVRLTHVECLEYSRARWLGGVTGEKLDSAVGLHLFARGRTGIRDDNALSRLWWNMHIASIADPADPEDALKLILKSADIRMSFVERARMASLRPLARALVRAMRNDPWLTSTELAFREFMKVLNRDGGGVLFEALSDSDVDSLLAESATKAQERLKNAG